MKRAVQRAVAWLSRPAVADSEYAYWRFLALKAACADTECLDEALNHVKRAVESGILHHENSPLREFYVHCVLEHGIIDDSCKQIIEARRGELAAAPESWSPERLAYVLSNLMIANVHLDRTVILSVLERLRRAATTRINEFCWHSLVSTAYIVIALLRVMRIAVDSQVSDKVAALVEGGCRYLVKKWDEQALISEPLAGGDFAGTDYVSIVVARALTAILDSQEPRWREEFQESSITDGVVARELSEQGGTSMTLNPAKVLKEAIRAVPAMKYALAVLALVGVVATVAAWRLDLRIAVFGAVTILVLMVGVLIFAQLTKLASRHFIAPAVFLMWTFVIVTAATGVTLFTAATIKWPPALYELIFGHASAKAAQPHF